MNPLPPSITVAAQKTSGKHQSSHQYGLEEGRSLNLRLLFLFLCVVTVAANCIETTQCQEGELSKEKIEAFRQAVIKGDLNTVEGLVSEITTSSAVMYRDDEGRSFLHLAVIHGHDKIVERFLKPVVFGLDLYDNDGLTALHWAIHQGNKRIVTLLLKHGASLIGTSHGSYNVSPIEMAVACGNPEIFEIVQEYVRSKVQHVSEKFGTLLHVAILNKESQMLAYLLKERKEIRNDVEKKGFKGMTPLQLAASTGNERAIEILVKIGRASVDAGEHQEGGTALHYAAKAYHADTMDLLYRFGANLDAKDNSSNTALSLLNLELSKDGKTLENIKPSDGKEIAARQLCVNRLRARLNEASYEKRSRPIYDKHLPQNLVFSGGAGKGIAYVGVLKKLDKKKLLSELVRTGGTSVGSIIAGLCSVGYTPNEIEEVMLSLDFTDLLDFRKESVGFLYSVYLLVSSLWGGKRLDSPQKLLGKIVTYAKKIPIGALSADSIGQAFVQKTAKDLVDICLDFHNAAGLAEGEKLRLEVERLIAHKTGIDYLTFGELNELTKKDPE
ncbi:MAG: ankyrin repeat domain-containing protein, partial [Chlamydiia bacterium]|nr:ankyrin repeat domain-containing protein [Chlamydiia bacterium]